MQVPETARGPLLPEGHIDNSWFSLSLGGGEDLAPARSLRTSSIERCSPIRQTRVAIIGTYSRGMSQFLS